MAASPAVHIMTLAISMFMLEGGGDLGGELVGSGINSGDLRGGLDGRGTGGGGNEGIGGSIGEGIAGNGEGGWHSGQLEHAMKPAHLALHSVVCESHQS